MIQREPVFPPNRHALYDAHGYSAAIRSGDLLFVSGQVGSRDDGTPEPDFAAQVQLAFDNLEATLSAAGCTMRIDSFAVTEGSSTFDASAVFGRSMPSTVTDGLAQMRSESEPVPR